MVEPATHPKLSRALCGEPVTLAEGRASARLVTTEAMVAELPKKDAPAGAPDMGGMGGMGGMGF